MLLLLACSLQPTAYSILLADTHYVDINCAAPTVPYTNWATAAKVIQNAVDAASIGDVVLVTDGVYDTGGTAGGGSMSNRVAINKSITVCSVNGADRTVIVGKGGGAEGADGGDSSVRCVHIAEGATLSGFTLLNGHSTSDGGGVWCANGALVMNCTICSNNAVGHGGGVFGGAMRNCAVYANEATYGGGVSADWSYMMTVENCTIMGNSAFYGGGAYGTGLVVRASIVYDNTALKWCDNLTDFLGATCEYSCTKPRLPGKGNIDEHPGILGLNNPHIVGSSPCKDGGCDESWMVDAFDIDGESRVAGLAVDIGCDEFSAGPITGRLGVAISAPFTNAVTGFPLIFQSQIEGLAAGYEWDFDDGCKITNVCVARHAYITPGSHRAILHAWNADGVSAATALVSIARGYTNYVSLSGRHIPPFTSWDSAAREIQSAIDANSYLGGVVLVSNGTYIAGGKTVHGGLTNRIVIAKPLSVVGLSGPNATVIKGEGTNGTTAVRCAYLGACARLTGFTLKDGHTRSTGDKLLDMCGGGCWCEAGAIVSNCLVAGNSATEFGGGVYGGTVCNSEISDNRAKQGGGLVGCYVHQCTIVSNRAGVCGGGVAESMVSDCSVLFNVGGLGGGSYNGLGLHNCVVAGNFADLGGGVLFDEISNCTITHNGAKYSGGGVYLGHQILRNAIINSIVYGNTTAVVRATDDIYINTNEYVPVNYTCSQPQQQGTNNISATPLFVNEFGGNYSLSGASPCIDAGVNESWMFEAKDINANPRIINGAVDMGAYETPFMIDLRAFLEGGYNTNTHYMTDFLVSSNVMSRFSPYRGTSITVSQTLSNVTDWVLIELLDTNGTVRVSQSALLRRDGVLLSAKGTKEVAMEVSPNDQLYVAIKHRNHLVAMSTQPLVFTNLLTFYDFTVSSNSFFGGVDSCVELESGVWGLIGGDADGDGRITPTDREIVRRQKGMAGYLQGDLNLDGKVDGGDE